jgi:hypothetical protein
VRLLSDGSVASTRGLSLTIGIQANALMLAACLCALQIPCRGQTKGILCTGGSGQFASISATRVAVTVGAQKDRGFATRACEAALVWNKKKIPVISDAWQVDLDVMDVDLGLRTPVVAFQFKKSEADSQMTYEVYSLRGAPQLLRTITGGDFFSAADTDMDGRIEIWAGDAKAASGFEGFPLANFDFPPTVVMRFEEGRLVDVSSEFRTHYDRQIAQLRAQLDPKQLNDFKNSDGTFNAIPPWETEKLRALLSTKARVLEIVWAYLYSGREQDAWEALADMWPAADLDRIRALMVKARAGGISSQVDGVSRPGLQLRKLNRVHVFNLTMSTKTIDPIATAMVGSRQAEESQTGSPHSGDIVMPQPISLGTPPPPDIQHTIPKSGFLVDLVIDGAGKVFSASLVNEEDNGPIGDSLISASGHWKFIPAIKNGQAVASHIRLTVSPFE